MTKFEQISLILSGIQTLVIVLSLLAVWRQLKQFNYNIQDNAYTKHLEDYSQLTKILLDKPELNEIFYSKNPIFQNLNKSEKDFYNYSALAAGFLERLWTLRQKGAIEVSTWNTWELWFIEQWFPLNEFETFWQIEGKYFLPGFFDEINQKYKIFKAEKQEFFNKNKYEIVSNQDNLLEI